MINTNGADLHQPHSSLLTSQPGQLHITCAFIGWLKILKKKSKSY